jgi:PAS domain S-box-containing protein
MTAPKILVVEDNPLTRKMLRLTLESEGYTVVEAGDGRAALAAAERELPALVLQDLVLPDMNGFELVRQLRLLGGASVPILALSGFLNRVGDARSTEAGFNDLLVKPIEPSRLLEVIRAYLPQAFGSAILGRGCRVLAVDDDLVQLKLTRLQLTQLGFEVTPANSSRDALRLARISPPDVVLSDVLMPDLDGFQLCYEIRNDPLLARVPVVLASAWYETAADRQLAERVGATALVLKTPDLKDVPAALLSAVKQVSSDVALPPDPAVRLEHAQAVIRQLERQASSSVDLARRCTLQAAQISLLSGVADALALKNDVEGALRDVLAATLDAAGISKGALYLHAEGEGPLRLRHEIGFAPEERSELASFFGHFDLLEDVVRRQATLSIPSSPLPESVGATLLAHLDAATSQVVPLVSEGRGVGVMVLCARHTDVTNEDSIAFARAMGNQLAQSLELARSFARLTASERRYRAVTEAAHEAISLVTPDGIIQEVNPSFEAALGLPRDRILGRRLRDFAPVGPEEQTAASSAGEPVVGGNGAPAVSLVRSDGSVVMMEFTSQAVDLGGEKLIVSIGRDVTERVKTQAQLMFSDRMASIGALAAGVAHEINNPLMATVANLEFALDLVKGLTQNETRPELQPLEELLHDAAEGAECVRTIVRDLKIFSRAEEDNRAPVEVQRVIESSLRMAWNEIRHRASLVREYSKVPPVQANESRLGQVFLNLIVNAAQALPDGYADQNQIRVRTRLDQRGRVVAEIEDTGPGIPPEVVPRLFTPFFTTKPRGLGTGLGLSICKRIVTSFGGDISVDTELGRGTIFRVSLVATEERPGDGPMTASSVPTAPRRGRVLIVDDDERSAIVVSRALAAEHDVATSSDADDALARIAAEESPFDVIICDMMMPVKTGVEFFADLAERVPEQEKRIIFLTGGAFTVKAREFLDHVPNRRLEKPFDMLALRAMVNQLVIDGHEEARARTSSPLVH